MQKDTIKEQIFELIQGYNFGRYMEDLDLKHEDSFKLLKNNINQYLNQKPVETLFVHNSGNSLQGCMLFRVSDWDSIHFGLKTVIIDYIFIRKSSEEDQLYYGNRIIGLFLEWCSKYDAKFVVAKIPSLDLLTINCLEKAGFNFIESWIFNKYDLRRNISKSEECLKLRLAEEKDLQYMLSYSSESFSTQRFHADFHIPNYKAEELYKKWIHSAFNDPKQNILVYDEENIPCAFMIYYRLDLSAYFNLKFAMWKMALLNPELTGRGIGSKFFSAVCDYHRQENLDVVDSGLSLRNIVSLNTHNKTNFKVVSTLVTLHLWL